MGIYIHTAAKQAEICISFFSVLRVGQILIMTTGGVNERKAPGFTRVTPNVNPAFGMGNRLDYVHLHEIIISTCESVSQTSVPVTHSNLYVYI